MKKLLTLPILLIVFISASAQESGFVISGGASGGMKNMIKASDNNSYDYSGTQGWRYRVNEWSQTKYHLQIEKENDIFYHVGGVYLRKLDYLLDVYQGYSGHSNGGGGAYVNYSNYTYVEYDGSLYCPGIYINSSTNLIKSDSSIEWHLGVGAFVEYTLLDKTHKSSYYKLSRTNGYDIYPYPNYYDNESYTYLDMEEELKISKGVNFGFLFFTELRFRLSPIYSFSLLFQGETYVHRTIIDSDHFESEGLTSLGLAFNYKL